MAMELRGIEIVRVYFRDHMALRPSTERAKRLRKAALKVCTLTALLKLSIRKTGLI